jgi:asparagine synthase (glutamine-hydrolysing)
MCGIVGIFDTTGNGPVDTAALSRMNQSQFHRGPVEGGLHLEPGLGLGHRRLSVIDLANGQQPLFNEDGSVGIVFNGEIYNFRALRRELTALGHVFSTRCDTEVIVHAWEQWGEACVGRLRGMFSFALWDRKKQSLLLARDRLGIKPLFYAMLDNGLFIFGSELKSLLTCPELPRTLDPYAVEEYFAFGYVAEPRSIYQRARKLAPGHLMRVEKGQGAPLQRQYWDVPFVPMAPRSEDDIADELVERLRDAVDSHLEADVPLGAFLSGGVDSSAVVAMMAGLGRGDVSTSSIGFDSAQHDESAFAAQVAQRYHTRHHEHTVAASDCSLVDGLAALYDEPYADSSAIPTYRVCQLARRHVTVALSGDGGDENFAGYRRYRYAMAEESVRSAFPSALRGPLFGTLGKWYPKADWAPRMFRAKTTFEALARDTVDGYFHGVSLMPDRTRRALFSDGFQRSLGGYRASEVLRGHARNSPTGDPLSMIQYLDMKTYLPGDILTKVDRASMAHALEVRVPLLDHEFVEWVSGLPPGIKLKGGQGKHIFKKALTPFLSDDILYRAKRGFSVPLAQWLRGPLRQRVRQAVLGPMLLGTGYFNEPYLRHLVEHHESGQNDYSVPLWSLMMFESFLRTDLARQP